MDGKWTECTGGGRNSSLFNFPSTPQVMNFDTVAMLMDEWTRVENTAYELELIRMRAEMEQLRTANLELGAMISARNMTIGELMTDNDYQEHMLQSAERANTVMRGCIQAHQALLDADLDGTNLTHSFEVDHFGVFHLRLLPAVPVVIDLTADEALTDTESENELMGMLFGDTF